MTKQVGQIADFTCPDCLSNMEIVSIYNYEDGSGKKVIAKCVKEDCSRNYSEKEVI